VTAAADAQIVVSHLGHEFRTADGQVRALEDINLHVAAGEFVCLLGPSGCGKSTLLNALAGFVPPTSGNIHVAGTPIAGPGPDRAMVFQDYALFPWMTVADNVAFGLRVQRKSRADIARRVTELLELLELGDFSRRFPKDLSGGMRQRVAIARVLAIDPPILLMDEPFGALDALTRRSLQDQLLELWSRLGKTIVFVTHSIEESIYLADRVLVLTYRPGTIKYEMAVELARPRDPSDAAFNELERQLTAQVMTEQQRHEAAERAPPRRGK